MMAAVHQLLWKRGNQRQPKKFIAIIPAVLRYFIISAELEVVR
jgi:hypothetical protein